MASFQSLDFRIARAASLMKKINAGKYFKCVINCAIIANAFSTSSQRQYVMFIEPSCVHSYNIFYKIHTHVHIITISVCAQLQE